MPEFKEAIMKIDKISSELLEKIADLHEIPTGAVAFRKNGKSEMMRSTANIEIEKKSDGSGINIHIHSSAKGEACHIPAVVTENGLFDLVYNDFYIEDGADVTIVAGCGVHSSEEGGHEGVHTFHIGKYSNVVYLENHLAIGKSTHKIISPTTIMTIGEGSMVTMNTTQLGGVDYSNRKTKVRLGKGSKLVVNEKVLTDNFNLAKTDFVVDLNGENSKCELISRSVARGESEQIFKSTLVGKNKCFGHVECDGILLDSARIDSSPKVSARHSEATLTHEASIGRIAEDQLMKLMTMGLDKAQAEDVIIQGFLK